MQSDEQRLLGQLLERTAGLDKKVDEFKQDVKIHLGKIELSLSAGDRRQEERVQKLENRVDKLEDGNLLAEGGRMAVAKLAAVVASFITILGMVANYFLSR